MVIEASDIGSKHCGSEVSETESLGREEMVVENGIVEI